MLRDATAVAFAPNGNALAIGWRDGRTDLSAVAGAQPIALGVLTGHTGAVSAVTYARNGRVVATGSSDGSVMVWDASVPFQPFPLMTVGAQMGPIADASFAPKGAVLAAAGDSQAGRIWAMDAVMAIVEDPVRQACTMLGGGLDAQEWKSWVPSGTDFRQTC